MSSKLFTAMYGMEYYHGVQALNVGDTLFLVKDPDNPLNHRAIKVVIPLIMIILELIEMVHVPVPHMDALITSWHLVRKPNQPSSPHGLKGY